MITILLLMMIVCGLMMVFGATKMALCIAIASFVGSFSYRIWFIGENLQSVSGDAFFCLALLPIGWYAAKQFIKLENSFNQS